MLDKTLLEKLFISKYNEKQEEPRVGKLEVIVGSMFSGKTEELIRRVRRIEYAKKKALVIKHSSDVRYDENAVTSHNKNKIEKSTTIKAATANDILNYISKLSKDELPDVIAIDEIQFFDNDIIDLIKKLVKTYRVIVAGLDQDFRGEPFGFMGYLMAISDDVQKLHAVCMKCGAEASRTQRIVNGKPARYDEEIILVGASECYEARCNKCHEVVKGDENGR